MLNNRAHIGQAVLKGKRLYRYYVSQTVPKHGAGGLSNRPRARERD